MLSIYEPITTATCLMRFLFSKDILDIFIFDVFRFRITMTARRCAMLSLADYSKHLALFIELLIISYACAVPDFHVTFFRRCHDGIPFEWTGF